MPAQTHPNPLNCVTPDYEESTDKDMDTGVGMVVGMAAGMVVGMEVLISLCLGRGK
jgi:hypothetical protein